MKALLLLVSALAVSMASPAWAEKTLAEKRNCTGCHDVEKRQGAFPSFKEVAAKYAGKSDAADTLALKIMKGGSGSWGVVPMPENPHVSQAEAKQLAAWIMSVK
jgi:cytochrome c